MIPDPTFGREKETIAEMRMLYQDISYMTINIIAAQNINDTETERNCVKTLWELEARLYVVNEQVDLMISELVAARKWEEIKRNGQ